MIAVRVTTFNVWHTESCRLGARSKNPPVTYTDTAEAVSALYRAYGLWGACCRPAGVVRGEYRPGKIRRSAHPADLTSP